MSQIAFLRRVAAAVLVFSAPAVFAQNASPAGGATPASEIKVPEGFKIELLKSASEAEGSWICMAIDGQGRLYISPQGAIPESGFKKENTWGGLWRATLDEQGQIAKWEKVLVPVGDAMGMLWAFDSLYVSGNGPEGRAIYRLKDGNGDGDLDQWELFKKIPGGNGEHGAHALVLGPDGKSIYIVHGNSTPLIEGTASGSPYRNYAEDDLLPRVMDPVATFFDKVKSPYGYVLRTDEYGSKFDLVAGGFRNPYDIDFNADGELFTYDSDMEWDVGLPWYRPTRVLHVIPGGEYGFREGSAKWPAWYPDSLPAAVNIGLGCPTGVKFGTKSNFPARYRSAFFILDWTFGRILAVHLKPKGASYTAENPLPSPYHLTGPASSPDVEEFARGKGLPVTDVEFGKDGAMYFTIGGRKTQAGLYRVSWTGEKTAPAVAANDSTTDAVASQAARNYRHGLEKPAVTPEAAAAPLSAEAQVRAQAAEDGDRFLYYAARLRAEQLPLDQLRKLALEEPVVRDQTAGGLLFGSATVPEVKNAARVSLLDSLMGLLALARVGEQSDQDLILNALGKLPLADAGEELQLIALRVLEVTFIRQGRPSTDAVEEIGKRLIAVYPAPSFQLNRELVQILVFLNTPTVVEKTLGLLESTTEPAEQVWYALCLREAANWTQPQRERYFSWFAKAANYRGGNSAKKFLLRIRDQALEKLPAADRPALLALAEKAVENAPAKPALPARPFVKAWTVDELVPALEGVAKGRDFARGQRLYKEAMCSQCHLFGGQGGAVGPDLTAVGSRFSRKDILEAIIEPSKAISEQYASFLFTMKDGTFIGGQIAEENHYLLTLIVDPINGTKQNISKGNVVKREMSPVSLMPPGLLFTLTKEEVLDLLAYLESGGNEKAANFAK